jgi:hypothetical protein
VGTNRARYNSRAVSMAPGPLAQWLEHAPYKGGVVGPIPTWTTIDIGGVPKRFKGTVLKTVSGVMLQPEFESLHLRQ